MCCTIANVTSFLVHRLSLRLYTPHICLNVHSRNNAKLGHELVPRKLNKIYSVPQWCVGEGKEPSMWAKCETTDWRRPRSEIDSVLHTSICEKALLVVLLLGRVFPHLSAHVWSLLHIQPGESGRQRCSRNLSLQNRLTATPYWLPCLWAYLVWGWNNRACIESSTGFGTQNCPLDTPYSWERPIWMVVLMGPSICTLCWCSIRWFICQVHEAYVGCRSLITSSFVLICIYMQQ